SGETFFSVVDGRADRRSPQTPPARLDLNPGLVTRAAAAHTPIRGYLSTSAGGAYYAAFPVRVRGDPRPGALVVAAFTNPDRYQVWTVVRVATAVGAGALVAAGLVGWLVAGRVLAPIRAVRHTAEQI